MSNFTPLSPEWHAERAAKMRAAKAIKQKHTVVVPRPPGRRGRIKGEKGLRWTNAETAIVAEHAAGYLIKQGIHFVPEASDHMGSRFMLDAVRKAMDAIPQDRRRLLRSRFNLGDGFYACLKKALKNPKPQSGFPNGAAPAAQNEPAPAPVLSPTIVAATSGALSAKSPASLDELPTEALVSALVMRLMRGLEQRQSPTANNPEIERRLKDCEDVNKLILEAVSDLEKEVICLRPSLTAPSTETVTEAPKPEPNKIHRVAILGCRKDQFDIINEEAKALKLPVELRWYDQNANPTSVRADWAIMLRWLSHSWEDHVKENIPKGQYVFIRGGVMLAVEQLRTWFAPETPQSES